MHLGLPTVHLTLGNCKVTLIFVFIAILRRVGQYLKTALSTSALGRALVPDYPTSKPENAF